MHRTSDLKVGAIVEVLSGYDSDDAESGRKARLVQFNASAIGQRICAIRFPKAKTPGELTWYPRDRLKLVSDLYGFEDVTFTEKEFGDLCGAARDRARSLDEVALCFSLLLALRVALAFDDSSLGYSPERKSSADSYRSLIMQLINGHMHPEFDAGRVINDELLRIRARNQPE